jgi:AcrR family transcriptional regulator
MGTERGRPRTFDIDDALERALRVFWQRGFADASLAELTGAMGLNKPSLYAAFGDKAQLYLQALDRYVTQRLARPAAALADEPDARRAVERFLRALAALYADPRNPGGCFIVNGAADLGTAALPPAVADRLRAAMHGNEGRIETRLRRAVADGHLPPDTDASRLAAYFMAQVAGLAVLAKAGARRAKLDAVIDAAMGAWPATPPRARRSPPSRSRAPASTRRASRECGRRGPSRSRR